MANVARAVLLSLLELDRLDQKPAFVKAPAAAEGSGTLGISVGGTLTEDEAKKLGLRRRQGGIKVASVYPSSPAASAGVEPGDVITALGREEIKQGREVLTLQNALRKLRPGQAFAIRVVRGAKRLSLRAEMP